MLVGFTEVLRDIPSLFKIEGGGGYHALCMTTDVFTTTLTSGSGTVVGSILYRSTQPLHAIYVTRN